MMIQNISREIYPKYARENLPTKREESESRMNRVKRASRVRAREGEATEVAPQRTAEQYQTLFAPVASCARVSVRVRGLRWCSRTSRRTLLKTSRSSRPIETCLVKRLFLKRSLLARRFFRARSRMVFSLHLR